MCVNSLLQLVASNYQKNYSRTLNKVNRMKWKRNFQKSRGNEAEKSVQVFILKIFLESKMSKYLSKTFFVCVDNLHVVRWCECWRYGTFLHASWWWLCSAVFAKATNINLPFHKISLRHHTKHVNERVRVTPWWLGEL